MFGFLLQWPTILTLLMFLILVWMYTRLAFQEERELRVKFGEDYDHHAVATPAFLPHFS